MLRYYQEMENDVKLGKILSEDELLSRLRNSFDCHTVRILKVLYVQMAQAERSGLSIDDDTQRTADQFQHQSSMLFARTGFFPTEEDGSLCFVQDIEQEACAHNLYSALPSSRFHDASPCNDITLV